MKILFIIAMDREAIKFANDYKLNKITDNYYKKDNIELLITSIGRNGVTSALTNLIYEYNIDIRNYVMINFGMVGSNNLKIGNVVMVNKSYGYNIDTTMFGDKLYEGAYSPYELDKINDVNIYDCYTSDGFVLKTDIKEDVIFDMELNSIITFPFKKKYSIKVVSDSLSNHEFNKFNYDDSLPKIYEIINKIIKENE